MTLRIKWIDGVHGPLAKMYEDDEDVADYYMKDGRWRSFQVYGPGIGRSQVTLIDFVEREWMKRVVVDLILREEPP